MGAANSQEPPAPWAPPEGKQYDIDVQTQILKLSESASTFLEGNAAYFPGFSLENEAWHLQGAINHDARLSQWLPKLVPKRVPEEHFWRNYFSHVKAVLATARLVDAPEGADSTPSASRTPSRAVSAAVGPGSASVSTPARTHTPSRSVSPHSIHAAVGLTPERDTQAHTQAQTQGLLTPAQREMQLQSRVGAASNGVHTHTPSHSPSPSPPPAPVAGAVSPHMHAHAHTTTATATTGRPAQTPTQTPAQTAAVVSSVPRPLESKQELGVIDETKLGSSIRWGIIGCGDVCEVKSGPAFQKCKGSSLVAVMRRTTSLARDFARRHGVPRYYTQVRSLISDVEVDAVYIATPPAGKPCLIEKPMARNADECRMMIEEFASAKVPLYVAYYRRCLPKFVTAKKIIQQNLGMVTSVQSVLSRNHHLRKEMLHKWRLDASQSGGGLFLDVGCHTLDVLDFFFGPLRDVLGDAVTVGAPPDVIVETGVSMTFRLQNGAIGSALWNFSSAIEEDRLTINGTKGQLQLSMFGHNDVMILRTADGKITEIPTTAPEHVHQPFIQTVVEELRLRAAGIASASRVPSTGESAMRTQVIMDAVLRRFYKSRQDEFWTRPHTWQSAAPPALAFSSAPAAANAHSGPGPASASASASALPMHAQHIPVSAIASAPGSRGMTGS